MHEIKEFEIIQFQFGLISRIRETTPDVEISEFEDVDTVGVDIQAEIVRAEEEASTLVGTFACSLQTDKHMLFAEFRAAVDGFEQSSENSAPSGDAKTAMFHLVYPYIRSSLSNIGRVADITLVGLPLSASFAE